jgi:hypothetical protein
VTSYNGELFFGLNADYDSMTDLDEFAGLIQQSLSELVAANEQAGARRRRLAPVQQLRARQPSTS